MFRPLRCYNDRSPPTQEDDESTKDPDECQPEDDKTHRHAHSATAHRFERRVGQRGRRRECGKSGRRGWDRECSRQGRVNGRSRARRGC